MRPLPAFLLAVLLLTTIAGCVDRTDRDDEDPAPTDDADVQDPPSGTTEPGTTDTGGPAPSPTEDDDPGEPSPPDEQKKDDPDDLERPGDHAMLPYRADRRTDVRLDVPEWNVDDTWDYDIWQGLAAGSSLHHTFTDTVLGTEERSGVQVYRVREKVYADNGSQVSDNVYRHLVDHLIRFEDDGYVGWVLHFPLEDGKRWMWRDSDGYDRISEVTYVPTHVWDGRTVTAWQVLTVQDEVGLEHELVFGAFAANVLSSETRFDGAPVQNILLDSYERSS